MNGETYAWWCTRLISNACTHKRNMSTPEPLTRPLTSIVSIVQGRHPGFQTPRASKQHDTKEVRTIIKARYPIPGQEAARRHMQHAHHLPGGTSSQIRDLHPPCMSKHIIRGKDLGSHGLGSQPSPWGARSLKGTMQKVFTGQGGPKVGLTYQPEAAMASSASQTWSSRRPHQPPSEDSRHHDRATNREATPHPRQIVASPRQTHRAAPPPAIAAAPPLPCEGVGRPHRQCAWASPSDALRRRGDIWGSRRSRERHKS
jgi:hypothetical protein